MPKVSISKGFGLFQQLYYNLSLYFTPVLQSAFYTDRIKNIKIRNRQCPFINEEVKHLMRNRDTLHKLTRTFGLAVDWERYENLAKW